MPRVPGGVLGFERFLVGGVPLYAPPQHGFGNPAVPLYPFGSGKVNSDLTQVVGNVQGSLVQEPHEIRDAHRPRISQ